jgi:hypothetical protein
MGMRKGPGGVPRCNVSGSLRPAKIFTTDGTDGTDAGNAKCKMKNLYP